MFALAPKLEPRPAALPDGSAIACLNRRGLSFLYEETFREAVFLKNGIVLREGDCVVDVGAYIGMFPLFLSQRFADLDIYALEPVPAHYCALSDNAERHFPLARCIPMALAERERRVQLACFPHAGAWSTRYPQVPELRRALRTHCALGDYPVLGALARRVPRMFDLCALPLFQHNSIEVDATTLSYLMVREAIASIDLLKIDVEGSEIGVLMGVEEEDWARIRQVVVKTTEADLAAVLRLLRLQGFRCITDVSTGLRGTGYIFVYALS